MLSRMSLAIPRNYAKVKNRIGEFNQNFLRTSLK